MKKMLSVMLLGSILMGCQNANASVAEKTLTLEEKLNQIASESSYNHGTENGEYHETEVVEAIDKIKKIIDEDITTTEKIQKLNQIASDSSYEHGIGNGEYHETEVTKIVFDVIQEIK